MGLKRGWFGVSGRGLVEGAVGVEEAGQGIGRQVDCHCDDTKGATCWCHYVSSVGGFKKIKFKVQTFILLMFQK